MGQLFTKPFQGANGSAGGAATATIKAGGMIGDADTIWVVAYNQSQWDD